MPHSAGRLLVLICTALILPGVAAATGPAPDVASPSLTDAPAYDLAEAGSGELLWKGPHGLVPLPVVGIEVDIRVTGMMVRGSVTQTFSNPIPAVIEALYVFPLPERAAVDAMEMHVGNRRIVAVVQEKEAAKRTYERARKAGRKAGLVNQKRPNLFTTSVANINPGETISVRLEYLEELAYDDGVFSLVFPLTFLKRGNITGVNLANRV